MSRLNREKGNGDSGIFVQRRGSWKLNLGPLLMYESAQKSADRAASCSSRRRNAASRMLVCIAQNACATACAVPAVLSPHPTASLRSAGTLLIQSTLTQCVAASSTSFEANTYDHYISHGMCTVRGRNHRPIAWCDQRARLARLVRTRTLLTAHSLRLLRGAFAIESRHRSANSCSATT